LVGSAIAIRFAKKRGSPPTREEEHISTTGLLLVAIDNSYFVVSGRVAWGCWFKRGDFIRIDVNRTHKDRVGYLSRKKKRKGPEAPNGRKGGTSLVRRAYLLLAGLFA